MQSVKQVARALAHHVRRAWHRVGTARNRRNSEQLLHTQRAMLDRLMKLAVDGEVIARELVAQPQTPEVAAKLAHARAGGEELREKIRSLRSDIERLRGAIAIDALMDVAKNHESSFGEALEDVRRIARPGSR